MRSRLSASRAALASALLLAGCGTDGGDPVALDQARYQRAIETALEDPAAAWDACATVRAAGLRTDCRLASVEAWAGHKGEPTAALLVRCAELTPLGMAHECAFQVGERRSDPEACALAGRFADDCRLHLLSAGFRAWVPKDARVDDAVLLQRLASEAQAVGLGADDLRPWSAWFRGVLDQQPSVDRSACQRLDAPLAEACWQTGRALYEDRLNMARDRGLVPCGGGAPPRFLATGGDAELDARLAVRMEQDLCPAGGGE
jgi:hypothetical protein